MHKFILGALLLCAAPLLAQDQGQQSAGIVFYSPSSSSGGSVGPGTANCIPVFATTTTLGTSDLCNVAGSGNITGPTGTALTFSATAPTATTGASQAGKAVNLTASAAVASTDTNSAAAGGNVVITGGAAAQRVSGNAQGGNIDLMFGAGVGTSDPGYLRFGGSTSSFPALSYTSATGPTLRVVLADGSGNGFIRVASSNGVHAPIQFGTQAGLSTDNVSGVTAVNTTDTGYTYFRAAYFQINADTDFHRVSTGVGTIGTGAGSGAGDMQVGPSVLTAGTMTQTSNAFLRQTVTRFDFTNAMVTALGAVLTGNITVATLPAKTVVKSVWTVVQTACGGTTTMTMGVGRTSALYVDYVSAGNMQASAGTVYGATSGTRGTNNTGYDVPSYTGTTALIAIFTSTGSNLSSATTCTGSVYVESYIAP